MDVNELKKLKKEILDVYNNEKNLKNNDNANLIDEELEQIKNEIDKIDSLIEIYQDNNIKFRVMMLERLYMRVMTKKSKEEFDKLSMDDEIEIYDKLFPDTWVLSLSLEKKQEYLEMAICDNKTLFQICSIDDIKKKRRFMKKKPK